MHGSAHHAPWLHIRQPIMVWPLRKANPRELAGFAGRFVFYIAGCLLWGLVLYVALSTLGV